MLVLGASAARRTGKGALPKAAKRCLRIVPGTHVLYGCRVRSYVAALAWVAVGCALYGWQILSLALR